MQPTNFLTFYELFRLDYVEWSGEVGTLQIPPTQGFFVKTTGNGTLTFENSMRTHSGVNTFYKSTINNLLTLQINGNGFYDKSYIRFLDEATLSFDSKWDAYKLLSGVPEVPQIYTATSEEILSINSMPQTNMVPLFFEAGKSGIYTLEITEDNDFNIVILEDKLTGAKTDLLAESYTFNFVEGDDAERFIVHFKNVPLDNQNIINIYSDKNNVFIINTGNLQGEVNIFNLLGQQVTGSELHDGRNIITLNDPKGIYIVKVKTNEKVQTKKVYIK